jgi:uncharacterized protein
LKRIGLLSDTHCSLDERILAHLGNCDEIWHAGDIGSLQVLEQLEKQKPVRAVFGNIDGLEIRRSVPEIQRFHCEEVDVLMKHIGGYPGKYDRSVYQIIKENPPRLFITGHSHILKVLNDSVYKLLHINPGAAGFSGMHKVRTLVRFCIEGSVIRDLEVIELDRQNTK